MPSKIKNNNKQDIAFFIQYIGIYLFIHFSYIIRMRVCASNLVSILTK